jgi:hypothetical protein
VTEFDGLGARIVAGIGEPAARELLDVLTALFRRYQSAESVKVV